MYSGTPSEELSRLLGLGLGDGMPLERSSSTWVAGDCYRDDPDDVSRGTVTGSGFGAPFDSAFLTAADLHASEDKIVSGDTLPLGDQFRIDSEFGFGSLGGTGFAMDLKSKGVSSNGISSEITEPSTPMAQSMTSKYFSDGDSPLSPPDNEFFSLCATTLHLVCDTPFVLGNRLLDFLANEVASSVTKVRQEKFCIKADVFMDNVMCTTKIKVWKLASPGLVAVEFQRRRGAIPTFNVFFQRATMYLQSHFTIVGEIPPVSSVLGPLPSLPSWMHPLCKGDATIEIGKIFAMAREMHNTPIQAESAAMLANLTEDEQKATLCTPEAAHVVTILLKEDATEVALPTAVIVLALSKCSAAIPYFIAIGQEKASSGFLDLSINKIIARSSCTLVRRNLAQAVAIAIDACVAQLSQDKASQLYNSISAAIGAISKERGLLQESPAAAADIDAIDQSLRRAALRLYTR